MDFWITFWGLCFLICMVVFAGMAVIVAVGGVSDIRALFTGIDEQHRKQEGRSESESYGAADKSTPRR